MRKQNKPLYFTDSRDRTRSQLRVVYRPISELKLDPNNPRVHSPKQLRQIALSIETFGFVVPALVDAKGRVITGHGRIMACKQRGWREVPTIPLEHLRRKRKRFALPIID